MASSTLPAFRNGCLLGLTRTLLAIGGVKNSARSIIYLVKPPRSFGLNERENCEFFFCKYSIICVLIFKNKF